MKMLKFLAGVATMAAMAGAAHAEGSCPAGGTVRFGVEPYDTAARLIPIYKEIGQLVGKKIGCPVEVYVATSYNAEIEAMRNGKLEIGQFGPLGYVLAHQVAKAEAVAAFAGEDGKPATYFASIVTWPGSGIKTLADVKGHSFAYSDPASTSGHLFPAYGLSKSGIDPDKDIKGFFAGSHTASYEAIRNHKVQAGELNSDQIASAKLRNEYDPANFVTLWKSDALPQDPIAVRGDLPADFKAKLVNVLANLDLRQLSPDAQKFIVAALGPQLKTVPQNDAAYNQIRDLVSTLHIDLAKM